MRLDRGLAMVLLGFGLGCAGLYPAEPTDQPMTVSYEGSTRTITQGEAVVRPDDFPLPAPPGLVAESASLAEGEGASTLTYRLPTLESAELAVGFYETWFAEQEVEVEKGSTNLAGMKTTTLRARRDGRLLTVTVLDGMGARMLTLTDRPLP